MWPSVGVYRLLTLEQLAEAGLLLGLTSSSYLSRIWNERW